MKGDWREATKEHPCPICERTHFCRIGRIFVICTSIESQKATKAGYGWYHPLPDAAEKPVYVPKPKEKRATDAELHARWMKILAACPVRTRKVSELAEHLGVADWTLDAIGVKWDGRQWLVPTKNAKGLITGIDTRWKNGTKMVVTDSRRGLCYADNWQDYPGPAIIVEGPSDTAAALTMHLCVIGRPSNIAGMELLTRMLGKVNRQIIFIAERDRKEHADLPDRVRQQHNPQCKGCLRCHPGYAGPLLVAEQLQERIHRKPLVRFMPDDAKDMRQWLNQSGIDVNDGGACIMLRARLLRELTGKAAQ